MNTALWTVIVPVRSFTTAKSRLNGAHPHVPSATVARALAHHTLSVLDQWEHCTSIIIVSDAPLGWHSTSPKARHILQGEHPGLNGAVTAARATVTTGPVLVIHADLPWLSVDDLNHAHHHYLTNYTSGASATSESQRPCDWFIPDAQGTGTTALLLAPGSTRQPLFGVGSAERHHTAGYQRLTLPPSSGLRRDLDTPTDLDAALRDSYALAAGRFPPGPSGASGLPDAPDAPAVPESPESTESPANGAGAPNRKLVTNPTSNAAAAVSPAN